MALCCSLIDAEVEHVQGILNSISFNSDRATYFLKIYKITYEELMKLNEQPYKFPIEANKLLKLSISLGNLLKTLQMDEEDFQHQRQQQRQFLSKLNGKNADTNTNANANANTTGGNSKLNSAEDPFSSGKQSQFPARHVIHSDSSQTLQNQPHQMRFVKNLLTILKNFDIDEPRVVSYSDYSSNNRESMGSFASAPHTPQRIFSNGSNGSTVITSPIKLNSKQLLIEKLEINIDLDILFIYKVLFKLILEIYAKIRQNLIQLNENGVVETTSSSKASPSPSPHDENLSIFSTRTSVSQESNQDSEEYLKAFNNVLNRISHGIVQPFASLIYVEIVEPKINDNFTRLINNL
ncbi:hypothetical protein KGF56_003163 [Candida oxycetoniae]|uniref:Uncharacterized protein n=1 Tax=Candida oxycetoniae TaxID=497107 RepID=A0AAI9WXH4_9ASCO|nr:uncharacterized protein KGF56_003163 [Candida oxycetoniae]KAI3404004.1 hypothetical protein KGF56_003163 [Candida oxycetoniae]